MVVVGGGSGGSIILSCYFSFNFTLQVLLPVKWDSAHQTEQGVLSGSNACFPTTCARQLQHS